MYITNSKEGIRNTNIVSDTRRAKLPDTNMKVRTLLFRSGGIRPPILKLSFELRHTVV